MFRVRNVKSMLKIYQLFNKKNYYCHEEFEYFNTENKFKDHFSEKMIKIYEKNVKEKNDFSRQDFYNKVLTSIMAKKIKTENIEEIVQIAIFIGGHSERKMQIERVKRIFISQLDILKQNKVKKYYVNNI